MWTFTALAALLACNQIPGMAPPKAARIDVVFDGKPIFDKEPHPLVGRVFSDQNTEMPEETAKIQWAVNPPNLATINGGSITCQRSGDATVLATAAGLTKMLNVPCHPLQAVTLALDIEEVIIGDAPLNVPIMALDDQGEIVAVAKPTVEVTPPDAVMVTPTDRGDVMLTPLSVANAAITVKAGKLSNTSYLRVIERIATEPISIPDGTSMTYTLTSGRYRVDIQTRAANGYYYGVTVDSTSPACPKRDEAPAHQFECNISGATSLIIGNPSTFGMGPAQVGNVSIYRVP